jgi:hypothetical protein
MGASKEIKGVVDMTVGNSARGVQFFQPLSSAMGCCPLPWIVKRVVAKSERDEDGACAYHTCVSDHQCGCY